MADKSPKAPENPQAFPRAGYFGAYKDEGSEFEPSVDGMELRDFFAAQALKGMLSSPPIVDRTKVDKPKWAGIAYEWADAMLAARVRK